MRRSLFTTRVILCIPREVLHQVERDGCLQNSESQLETVQVRVAWEVVQGIQKGGQLKSKHNHWPKLGNTKKRKTITCWAFFTELHFGIVPLPCMEHCLFFSGLKSNRAEWWTMLGMESLNTGPAMCQLIEFELFSKLFPGLWGMMMIQCRAVWGLDEIVCRSQHRAWN